MVVERLSCTSSCSCIRLRTGFAEFVGLRVVQASKLVIIELRPRVRRTMVKIQSKLNKSYMAALLRAYRVVCWEF